MCQHEFRRFAQVVSALGPRFGEEGSSSEAVDFKGVQSAIEAAEAFLAPGSAAGDEEKSLIVPGEGGSGGGGPGGELPMSSTRAHICTSAAFGEGYDRSFPVGSSDLGRRN